jgi:hypothetical protein
MGRITKKKTFIFNTEWQETLLDFPPEVRLEVYDRLVEYVVTGVSPELSPMAKMAFSFIKKEVDYNELRYKEKVAQCSEAGKRGMKKRYQTITNDNERYQTITNDNERQRSVTNLTDNDNVNDNDKKEIELSNDNPKKKSFDLSFISSEYMEAFQEWLDYKKARKETYQTQMGVKKCYSHLLKLCEDNPAVAKQIVDQSIANNWAGLFELKTPGKVSAHPTGESGSNGLKLGKGERFENGRRTYGTGIANIPLNAPPRPSEQYFWNADNQQWAIA